MNQFGDLYSQYYDLLYSDKDYEAEADFVNTLIRENSNNVKTLLDMGCGTGAHAAIFCNKGYKVHGIDLSEDMLNIAKMRRKGKEKNLTFSHSSIQDFNLNKNYFIKISEEFGKQLKNNIHPDTNISRFFYNSIMLSKWIKKL